MSNIYLGLTDYINRLYYQIVANLDLLKGRATRNDDLISERIMTEKKTSDQDFLEFLIKNLVDHPEDVKVDRKVDEMGVLLSLKVNPEDMGQIIGKEGSTARAIRNLIRIIGLKNHARVNLKIEEPDGARPARATKAPEKGEGLEDLKL